MDRRYHPFDECNDAIAQLLQAMKDHEQKDGMNDLLLIVPKMPDEEVIMASGGKLIETGISPFIALGMALDYRQHGQTCSGGIHRGLKEVHNGIITWERETAREYTLIYVPQCAVDKTVMTLNGIDFPADMGPTTVLAKAMAEREASATT